MRANPTSYKSHSTSGKDRYPIQGNLALPGIEYAPEQVRRHGLQETHTWPLVSDGKRGGGFDHSFRLHASSAWGFPSLELRSGRAWTCLILDCDGPDGNSRLMLAGLDEDIPELNWVVTGTAAARMGCGPWSGRCCTVPRRPSGRAGC